MKRGDKIKVWKKLYDKKRGIWYEATVLRGLKNRTKPGFVYLRVTLDQGEYAEFWADWEDLVNMQKTWHWRQA